MNKKLLFFIVILNYFSAFAQNDIISRFVMQAQDIDYITRPKSLKIKRTNFNKNREKIDTLIVYTKLEFSKNGNYFRRFDYDHSNVITQLIEYGNKNQVKAIYRRKENSLTIFALQFFSKSREYPDSLNIYWGGKNKVEQYINHFSKNLPIKREYYSQDTLRNYNKYVYDSKKRIIKDNFYNTKNGFGITLDKSITGDKDQKDLYPNDSTVYSYKINKDTLITIRDRLSYNLKHITKNYESKDYSLTIKEEYDRDYLKNISYRYNYKVNDSTSEIKYYYINQKEIKDYFKTTTNSKKITSTWKMGGYYNNEEKQEITDIEILIDEFGNWIKKIYRKDDSISMIVEREIEYFNR